MHSRPAISTCPSACIAAASTIPGRRWSISTAKYAAAPGQKGTNPRAPTRYSNPELNALLDKMEARQPSAKDAEYVGLVKAATAIILRDLPQITLAEEVHALTFNTTYWTGFPSAKDPYVAPYLAVGGFQPRRAPTQAAQLDGVTQPVDA